MDSRILKLVPIDFNRNVTTKESKYYNSLQTQEEMYLYTTPEVFNPLAVSRVVLDREPYNINIIKVYIYIYIYKISASEVEKNSSIELSCDQTL
jgi:hypothetical protein